MLLLLEIIPYVTIFLFGIVVGSFLNVCIYRLPKQESIVKVPSHCMSCGAQLRWYDLVPLFSWLILRGRCRRCKAAISIQYPLIEGLNGILWVFVFIVNGMNGMSLVYCFMTSALLTLSVIDWRTFEIPFGINVFLGILGLVAVVLDKEEWLSHIIGAVCVSVFLLLLYVLTQGRAIGGGDIKLMAACGLLIGWQRIILAFLLGCILGSIIHIIRMKVRGEGHILAMGPYLAAGVFLAALFGREWITWYLSLLGI
ncbi:prepilin peptidase [Anaerobutyricum hallii]|uniref:prepilin peptidase n=1 Tax=Anaerobutyricum hallii TaxID=39488 RepID=UPI00352207A3